MYDTTITGTIAHTVTLESGSYTNFLSVSNAGVILGNDPRGGAVTACANGVTLVNAGNITGADAAMSVVSTYYLGPADTKIYGTVNIDYSVAQDGVSLTGASFSNTGVIVGGTGPMAGSDGAGIFLVSSTSFNDGVIEGGAAWGTAVGLTISSNGEAAPGGVLSGGYFRNDGTFLGGQGEDGQGFSPNRNYGANGSQGGDGIIMTAGGLLDNNGLITGGAGGSGSPGGTVTLRPWVTFSGGAGGEGGTGAYLDAGTLINFGLITGGAGGAGGSGNEQAAGLSDGTGTGVIIQEGLLINHGTIRGGYDAVSFTGSGVLQDDAGAVFDGVVQADAAATDTLVLSGSNGGTIWLGSQFRDFTALDLSAGTSWTVEGNLATLQTLTITGLSGTDSLELYGLASATSSYIAGNGLEISSGSDQTILPVVGGLNGAELIVAPCFCPGTKIRTPQGEASIECLRIGDEVMTAFGGIQRIKWIGHRTYEEDVVANNHLAAPICIKPGAIADEIPCRDLWVSPDHAIAEAGVLIPAWRLVNGRTIMQALTYGRVTYIHIELEGHHIIFADNCPTESFRDADCRGRFENADEYERQYGRPTPPGFCLPFVDSGFHLYNVQSRLALRAGIKNVELPPGPLRGNLDEPGPDWLRGWAQDISAPEQPVSLDVISEGALVVKLIANSYRYDLRRAGLGTGCHAFQVQLPKSLRSVQLRRTSDGTILGNELYRIAR